MALREPAGREINRPWLKCMLGSFPHKIAVVCPPIVTGFIRYVFLHRPFQQGPNADSRTANE